METIKIARQTRPDVVTMDDHAEMDRGNHPPDDDAPTSAQHPGGQCPERQIHPPSWRAAAGARGFINKPFTRPGLRAALLDVADTSDLMVHVAACCPLPPPPCTQPLHAQHTSWPHSPKTTCACSWMPSGIYLKPPAARANLCLSGDDGCGALNTNGLVSFGGYTGYVMVSMPAAMRDLLVLSTGTT